MIKLFLKKHLSKRVFKKILLSYNFFKIKIPMSIIGFFLRNNNPLKIGDLFIYLPKVKWHQRGSYFFYDDYEKHERALIKKHIDSEDVVLELGGSIGVVSCTINKLIKSKINHIVLEPNPNLIYFLEKNKKINECDFKIEQFILGNGKDYEFNVSKEFLSSSIYSSIDSTEKIHIKSIKLEDLENKYKTRFNTLIMDIEGQESEVLSKIDLSKFKKIIFELHEDILDSNDVNNLKINLKENNFMMLEKIDSVEYWKRNKL